MTSVGNIKKPNIKVLKFIRLEDVCAVKGCTIQRDNKRFTLFRFPKDEKRAKEWADACKMKEKFGETILTSSLFASHYRVCDSHFEENMFLNKDKTRLTSDAFPTLNLAKTKGNPIEVITLDDEVDVAAEPNKESSSVMNIVNVKRKCAVLNCYDKTSARHRFPVFNDMLFNAWRVATGDSSLEKMSKSKIYNSKAVCDKHFEDSDKEPSSGLKSSSVPTKFLPKINYIFGEVDKTCVYRNCQKEKNPLEDTVYYYKFPSNRIFEWRLASGRADNKITNYAEAHICSDHFNDNEFYSDCKNILNKSANPRIFNRIEEVKVSNSLVGEIGLDCLVNNCPLKDLQRRLFKFPKDPEVLGIWCRNLGLTDKMDQMAHLINLKVCVTHFELKMFADSGRTTLRAEGYPTQHLDKGTVLAPVLDYELPAPNKKVICSYKDCNSFSDTPNVRFFNFPYNSEKWNQWVKASGKDNYFITQYRRFHLSYVLCSNHFVLTDFFGPSKKYLHKDAVPIPYKTGPPEIATVFLKNISQINKAPVPQDVIHLDDDVEIVGPPEKVIEILDSDDEMSTEVELEWVPGTRVQEDVDPTCTVNYDSIDFHSLGKKLKHRNKRNNKLRNPIQYYSYTSGTKAFCPSNFKPDFNKGLKMKYHSAIILDDDDEYEKSLLKELVRHFSKSKTTTSNSHKEDFQIN